jgi:hypothetical protein
MQESPLGNPAFSLNQVLVHDGNLTRWPSEADKAKLEPIPQRLTEAHCLDSIDSLVAHFVALRYLSLLHLIPHTQ